MTFQELCSRLDNVKKKGAGYTALCPAHSDEQNSLSLSEKSDKIVLFCHAHCSVNEVCAALGIKIKDLFLTNITNTNNGNARGRQQNIVAIYPYRDEEDHLLYENVRFEPKDFRQRHFDKGGKEIWSLNGARRVPYRLPELIKAIHNNPDEIIYLTEGEKDADNLRELGFTASSFKNWKPEFNRFIQNAPVVLLTDHDHSGLRQANEAANVICLATQKLKLIDLFEREDLPEKHGRDISDWLELGHTASELKEIVEKASIRLGNPIVTTSETISPIPLPKDDSPAPELNECLLPDDWREWLTDIAERMQCPLDYPTVAAIVSAAALIGNKIRIRPKQRDIWQVTTNLWGAVVGLPSLLKSPAVNEGMFFFREIEKAERAIYETKLKDAEFDKEFAEAKQGELKKLMRKDGANKVNLRSQFQKLAVEQPKEKRLSTSDATVEKLGELLNENPNGILQIRDELTGWFRSLDRPGRESDRAFYLECWDGAGESKVDRIGRGSIPVKNLTLSIFGTIQPAMLKPFLRGSIDGDTDDGLIQRFQLLVYPNKPNLYQYVDRSPKGRDKARSSFKALYELDPPTIGAKQLADEFGGGWFVQFDDEAQEFFQTWLTELENALRFDTFEPVAFESHIAKYRSLMPSLALIFHLLDCVSGRQTDAVSLKNAKLAAAWCSYLQAHARRIYQIASLSEFDVAREILKKIQLKNLGKEFTAKDIYGKHWSKLSKPIDVQNGLEILTEYGYLTSVTINEKHRPKTVYFIHGSLQ